MPVAVGVSRFTLRSTLSEIHAGCYNQQRSTRFPLASVVPPKELQRSIPAERQQRLWRSGQVAQVVERSPEKAGVGGSTPSLATILSKAAQMHSQQPTFLRRETINADHWPADRRTQAVRFCLLRARCGIRVPGHAFR